MVFTRVIIALLIFELTSAGLFILNKSYPLAALCVPLIILTLAYKFMMDSAYQRSTQFLPLQLLSEKLGPMTTIALQSQLQSRELSSSPTTVEDLNIHPLNNNNDQKSASATTGESSTAVMKRNRKRRTVLDEDDYVADPRKCTDFREPPMTLLAGILNTGMKQYGHPALLGVLPQIWLPVKAGYKANHIPSNESSSSSFSSGSSTKQNGTKIMQLVNDINNDFIIRRKSTPFAT